MTILSNSTVTDKTLLEGVEAILQEVLEDFSADTGPTRGRPRVLPAMALWAGMLVCVLYRETSQLAIWRMLTQHGLWFSGGMISDQAVYSRLAKGGTATLERLFAHISALLCRRLQTSPATQHLAPFATSVMALDESTLDQVARHLPSLRGLPAKDDRLLPGKVSALFDVRAQQWYTIQLHEEPHQNEKVAARGMVETLPAGSLVLADLGYFGFAWFDWLTHHGYHWVSRLRAKTSYHLVHAYCQQGDIFDGVVWLGAYRADRGAAAVRLVRFRQGATVHSYITNVLDPRVLPLPEIARLYARRWDVEIAFNLVKQHLQLHLLWSAKPVVVKQQVWAVFIIAQILQALRLEIANLADVDPFDVSMQLLVQQLSWFVRHRHDRPLSEFIRPFEQGGCIRPSRRKIIDVPTIPEDQLLPLPADLVLMRLPRYAARRSSPI